MNLKLLKLISYQLKKLFQANTVLECIRIIIDYFFYFNKNKSACKLNVLSLGESEPAFQLKTIGKQKLKKPK